jgi:hypothetical protein
MSAEERTAASKKGYENGLGSAKSMSVAAITWEKKYDEFKRCIEMPESLAGNVVVLDVVNSWF